MSHLEQTDSAVVDSGAPVLVHLLPGFVALHQFDLVEYDRLGPAPSATFPEFVAYSTVVVLVVVAAVFAVCYAVACIVVSRRIDW